MYFIISLQLEYCSVRKKTSSKEKRDKVVLMPHTVFIHRISFHGIIVIIKKTTKKSKDYEKEFGRFGYCHVLILFKSFGLFAKMSTCECLLLAQVWTSKEKRKKQIWNNIE